MRISLDEAALTLLAILFIGSFLTDVRQHSFRAAIESAGRTLDKFPIIFFSLLAIFELLAVVATSLPLHAPPAVSMHVPAAQHLANALGWIAAGLLMGNLEQRSTRQPTAPGQLFASACIVWGLLEFLRNFVRQRYALAPLIAVVVGCVLIAIVRISFRRQSGEHRILQHVAAQGDVLQPEYHRATAECPEPERWRMYDSMTAEYEVLQFLQQLVETLKPKLIVETGTFMGISTLWLAQGLRANGAGKVVTCEYDPVVYAKAVERIEASGLKEWIDARNESSLEMLVDGEVDLLFSDSDPDLREAEVRRFLPLLRANGVILIHDASSHLRTVRDAALKLEREGLISVVLLPTPRGLVLAQKRAGRTE